MISEHGVVGLLPACGADGSPGHSPGPGAGEPVQAGQGVLGQAQSPFPVVALNSSVSDSAEATRAVIRSMSISLSAIGADSARQMLAGIGS